MQSGIRERFALRRRPLLVTSLSPSLIDFLVNLIRSLPCIPVAGRAFCCGCRIEREVAAQRPSGHAKRQLSRLAARHGLSLISPNGRTLAKEREFFGMKTCP